MKDGAVIIPAAGSGTRMKLGYPKQYQEINNIPVLIHTIRAFIDHQYIQQIVVVVPGSHLLETEQLLEKHNLKEYNISIVEGGLRRQDSVFNGLKILEDSIEIVLVHDGARPLIDNNLISACYETAKNNGAAIAAIPVKDTIKRQNKSKQVQETISRDELWQAQTPQAARRELLLDAFKQNKDATVTDESALLEQNNIPVSLVEGSDLNIKITRPADAILVQSIMDEKMKNKIKIGYGYDAHRLVEGRKLILGGVTVPYIRGLDGHSDADVVTHALCDALIGAIGTGDIGQHFPDTSATYKDICSIRLLKQVVANMIEEGYTLGNADISIICEAPKLAPYLPQMKTIMAGSCRTEIDNINIKATTTEKMGFSGRGEGIGCHAVVLIEKQ